MMRGFDIQDRPSPSYDNRGEAVSMIVLHYTGMPSTDASLGRLCNSMSQVSCHYLVGETGNVFRLVNEDRRAWHAGEAHWRGETDINARSIGIELQNPGHQGGYKNFADPQIHMLIDMLRDILSRYDIPARNIVGHAEIAPMRKDDPGERFPWQRLAESDIGLWHGLSTNAGGASVDWSDIAAVTELQEKLIALGFDLVPYGTYSTETEAAVKAFQRHWQQGHASGMADQQTVAILDALLDKI